MSRFRRFQFPRAHDYSTDGFEPKSAYDAMQILGTTLGDHIPNDLFAPSLDPQIDPEGLAVNYASYKATKSAGQAPDPAASGSLLT